MKSEASGDLGTPIGSNADSAAVPSKPFTMIECVACGDMAFTLVVCPEAEGLFSDGAISRPCKFCGKGTMWMRVVVIPALTRN